MIWDVHLRSRIRIPPVSKKAGSSTLEKRLFFLSCNMATEKERKEVVNVSKCNGKKLDQKRPGPVKFAL
jgi:hypothetical protein